MGGGEFAMPCPKCQVEIAEDDRFCSACGENLGGENESDAAPMGGGERRRVTAVFDDVVGSTPLAERVGEEVLYNIMAEIIADMSAAVADHGGTIEKLTGDGLMALFGAPLAVEDAPLNACRAGLDILARIGEMGRAIEAEHGERPEVRIGVNSGYAVVGALGGELQQEVTALGDSVNVAARLEGLAAPGTMVVGEATYQLVADFVVAEYGGEHDVKGKAEAQKNLAYRWLARRHQPLRCGPSARPDATGGPPERIGCLARSCQDNIRRRGAGGQYHRRGGARQIPAGA
jgi:class 3 adenylate cyclase